MPIPNIPQPEILPISPQLRLRKYDYKPELAFDWYQDEDMVYMMGGKPEKYTMEKLLRMYTYLDGHGELY